MTPAPSDDPAMAVSAGGHPVPKLFARPVFAVANRTYTWEDVFLAAKVWGDWDVLEGEVRRGLVCLKRAEAAGEEPSAEELEAAAAEFRYAHDLVAGEDMEAWLEERELSVESWMQYIRRTLLKQRWDAAQTETSAQQPVSDEELQSALLAEALCSAELARLARKLAVRVAIYEIGIGGPGPAETHETPVLTVEAAVAEAWREKAEALERIEQAFRRFRERAATPQALADQLGAHQLDWVRLDCRVLSFPDEQMALEAALCLREDATPVDEVAAQAQTAVREEGFYLEDVGDELRGRLLGAQSGELLGPLEVGGEFVLFLVSDKRLPTEEDPEIRRRAEERILAAAVDCEVAGRVRWLTPL